MESPFRTNGFARFGLAAAAQRRVDPRRELGRRERLDDIVGGAGLQGLGDGLAPFVAGDEDDRQIGQFGQLLHQLDPIGPGQHQVQQDELGLLGADDMGQLLMITGDDRVVAGRGECIAHVAQHQRIVVYHQNACRLGSFRPSARPAPGDLAHGAGGGLHHRNREREPHALALTGTLGPDAAAVRFHQPLADGEAQAGAPESALRVPAADVFPKQVRKPLLRHAPALVGDRDRHVHRFLHRGDPDRGGGRGCRLVVAACGNEGTESEVPMVGGTSCGCV